MPKERNTKINADPKVEIIGIRRISNAEVVDALKQSERIPADSRAQMLWEDNGRPARRSQEEERAAYEQAKSWAASSVAQLQKHLKTDPEITLLGSGGQSKAKQSDYLLMSLTMSRAHENIDYLFSASAMYLQIVDTIITDRQNVNPGTIRWARELTDHADSLYRTHISRGGYDNEFAPVWEDLRYTNNLLGCLEKLRPRDFSEINFIIDDLLTQHSTGIKNEELGAIDHQIFTALLKQKSVAANELNNVAFLLVGASEEALNLGGKELAQKLYGMAKSVFTRYRRWQMAEGIVPNTSDRISLFSDPRLHDQLLVHKALAKLEQRLSES